MAATLHKQALRRSLTHPNADTSAAIGLDLGSRPSHPRCKQGSAAKGRTVSVLRKLEKCFRTTWWAFFRASSHPLQGTRGCGLPLSLLGSIADLFSAQVHLCGESHRACSLLVKSAGGLHSREAPPPQPSRGRTLPENPPLTLPPAPCMNAVLSTLVSGKINSRMAWPISVCCDCCFFRKPAIIQSVTAGIYQPGTRTGRAGPRSCSRILCPSASRNSLKSQEQPSEVFRFKSFLLTVQAQSWTFSADASKAKSGPKALRASRRLGMWPTFGTRCCATQRKSCDSGW